jgi:hypothetical protein
MGSVQVSVIGREGCHLCDEASAVIAVVTQDFSNVDTVHAMIEDNPDWLEFYSDKVPVILIDGVEHGYWRVNEDIFRGALVQAGALPRATESE